MLRGDDSSQISSAKRPSCSSWHREARATSGDNVNANANANIAEEAAKERRRYQNRVAQRNHRRRKAAQRVHGISNAEFIQANSCCGHDATGASADDVLVRQALFSVSNSPSRGPGPSSQQHIDVLPTPTDSGSSMLLSMDDIEFECRSGHGGILTNNEVSIIEGAEAGDVNVALDCRFLEREANYSAEPEEKGDPAQPVVMASTSDVVSSDSGSSPKRRASPQSRAQGCGGQLALHLAAQGGHNSIIDLLLNNGAHLDLADDQGRTALHYAIIEGHAETLKKLLSWGADSRVLDSEGLSGLHLAARMGHEPMVLQLITHGADPNLRTGSRTSIILT